MGKSRKSDKVGNGKKVRRKKSRKLKKVGILIKQEIGKKLKIEICRKLEQIEIRRKKQEIQKKAEIGKSRKWVKVGSHKMLN